MTENLSTEEFDENYRKIISDIAQAAIKSGRKPEEITLLAATKTVDAEHINHAADIGLEYMGENRVQEFLSKNDEITPSLHRHFIGHLQTNKVKDIIDKVEMIESVHSVKLAQEIGKTACKAGKTMNILAEINIGNEENKSGLRYDEAVSDIKEMSEIPGIKVMGLMAIPPVCDDNAEIFNYFNKMHKLFIDIRDKKMDNVCMLYLSMGMSNDYVPAILCGANIVRIGSALFGKRIYQQKEI